ncbi:ABC transporter ATP-binding protein [Enterococcus sp. N342-3-1-2]
MVTPIKKQMLHVKHLQKSFKDNTVLEDVTFDVTSGEVFVLLGSNGAGKTTLVKILSTILPFDQGTACINEIDLTKDPAAIREKISLTGQFSAVDQELTGRENLLMIAALRHVKNKQEIVEDLLTRFDLVDASNRLVKDYSGGMRRRLDIAMSFIGEPDLLFLDEPTTGLDPQNRLATWHMIKEIAAQGRTIFLTTQYLEEAEFLADQVAILHEGKIILQGTPTELKKLHPSQTMEISVLTKEHLQTLRQHLSDVPLQVNVSNLSLTLPVSQDFHHAFTLLQDLNQLPITITSFSQKNVSLEDIFLTLVQGGTQ